MTEEERLLALEVLDELLSDNYEEDDEKILNFK